LNFTEHEDFIYALTLLSNGDVVSGDDGGKIKVWSRTTGIVRLNLTGHSDAVRALVTLQNDDIVSASFDGTVIVWDSTNGAVKMNFTGHSQFIYALTLLSNDDIVSGSADNSIIVWNKNTGEPKLNITDVNEVLALTTLQPDNDIVSGGIVSFTIRVWNSTDGAFRFILSGHSGNILWLTTLSTGEIVSTSNDQTTKVWNLTDRTPKTSIPFGSRSNALTILSNDEIVCGYNNGLIVIYLSNGTQKQSFNAFQFVFGLVSYPNDDIVSGATDNIGRIWTKV
jgi:WD40 repeat protein